MLKRMLKVFACLSIVITPFQAVAQLSPAMFQGFIGGLTLSNDQTSPNTILDIAQGSAVDSTAATFIQVPAIKKLTSCSWTAGSGGCGMAPGMTVAANHWYSVFAIMNGGAGDIYFDLPQVTPTTEPSGTTAYRHLGWFMTDANSNIQGMLCIDETCWWKQCECNTAAGTYDYVAANPCGTAVAASGNLVPCTTTITLSHIPPGAPVTAILNLDIANISIPEVATFWVLTSPDAPYTNGIGVSGSEPQLPDVVTNQVMVPTNAYSQVLSTVTSNPAGSGSSPTVFVIDSKGWIYHRMPPASLPAVTGIATPTNIGTVASTPGARTSFGLTTFAPVAAGNLVAVCVAINSTNTTTVSSVSDGVNSYVKAKQLTISANTDIELWYAANALPAAAGTVLTANLSGSTGANSGVAMIASQASGIAAMPLDQTAALAGTTGTSLTATTGALVQATELALGCSYQIPAEPYSGSAGFTNQSVAAMPSGNGSLWLDFQLTASAAAVSYTPTWAPGGSRIGAVVGTFK